jgi:hypothetical protein
MESIMNERHFIERIKNEAESLKFYFTETESTETTESKIDYLTFKALQDSLKSLEVHQYQNEVLIRMTRHFTCKEISERCISKRGILMLLISLVKSNVGHLWQESNFRHLEMFAVTCTFIAVSFHFVLSFSWNSNARMHHKKHHVHFSTRTLPRKRSISYH